MFHLVLHQHPLQKRLRTEIQVWTTNKQIVSDIISKAWAKWTVKSRLYIVNYFANYVSMKYILVIENTKLWVCLQIIKTHVQSSTFGSTSIRESFKKSVEILKQESQTIITHAMNWSIPHPRWSHLMPLRW